MKKLPFLLFLVPFWFSGCSATTPEQDVAEKAVADFHDAYNRRDFEAIYKVTGLDYRHFMTEAAMKKILENAHAKLGKEIACSETSILISTTNNVSHITILVQAQFADGMAPEKFNYTVYGGKVFMDGYHIDVPR